MEWQTRLNSSLIPIGSWDTQASFKLHLDNFVWRPFGHESPKQKDNPMVHALEILKQLEVLQYRRLEITSNSNNGQSFSRFLIYAINDVSSTSGATIHRGTKSHRPPAQQSRIVFEMVLLNMNVDPWIFQHELEATPPGYSPTTIFQDDSTKRLINIYLDMPSPRACDDPFMRPDVRTPSKETARLLQQALERDSPRGMRTKLYNYQKKSLWKLLRRELCPDYIIDPTFIPLQDMDNKTYYLNIANGGLTICRQPGSKWDDVAGGIICEDMTLKKSSQPPSVDTRLHCELDPQAKSPSLIVQDEVASMGSSSVFMIPKTRVPSLQHFAAAAVRMGQIDYMHFHEYINPGTLELLEDMSVYYYHEEANAVNARSSLSRAKQFKMMERTPEIFMSSATLVIVPPNLTDQWCNEVNKHTEDFALKLLRIESGLDKEIPDCKVLMKYDMVLITQTRFAKEYEPGAYSYKHTKESNACQCRFLYAPCRCPIPRSTSPLMQIRWKRVIVDEGHSMGLKLSDHTLLAEQLHADHRWICSGTPTFNLANLQPRSISNGQTSKSDKGDLERLGTLMRSFLHLQPYHEEKNLFSKTLVKSLEDHHRIRTKRTKDTWTIESLSSVARLRYLMDRIMVRNKPADVARDVKLPPLYERIVRLDLEYFQGLTINCLIAFIQANAVLTEREDQDYFFHPSNRKHLTRVIENLKDGCFWYPGGDNYQEHLRSTLENVQKGIEKHQATPGGKYPKEDFEVLVDTRRHLNTVLGHKNWTVIQKAQEIGYYCKNLPVAVQRTRALIPASEIAVGS
ncbi:hypothetical protein BGZ65_003436 [Modicella reniformis]|uniref:SNF2 N-terminal domain-containing protein n=1 Tax=Modicella reniformis TaxID=1440133 RepID=A0A9P6J021_9FUNG|nr:hypothetical protein BGZ65_003436 [Modicella reniformis]